MLTSEVVNILRKSISLALALLFAFGSHLRPCCDFSVAGERIMSGCTPAAAKQAALAALMAAEEILPQKATLPEYRRHVRLSLRPGADTAPELSDALLRAAPGVMRGEAVYVQGIRIGTVEDAGLFAQQLKLYIDNTLPSWASAGSIRGLSLESCYTRADAQTPSQDLIMLITGLSPVMYTDGKGRISPV